MTFLAPLLMFGWPVVVLLLFRVLPAPRALVAGFVGAWLFLPVVKYELPGIPDYTKSMAACIGAVLHLAVFDFQRLLAFRPRWADLPAALICLSPLASSLTNGLGLYTGLAGMQVELVYWGIPYLCGRIYLADGPGLRALTLGIVAGGLLYVPLCLFEARMSPQLHQWIYGFHQHDWVQAKRLGGWRPTVFLQHGLAVSFWMAMCTLAAFWLWATGACRRFARLPMIAWTLLLAGTTVVCKSMGAFLLLGAGLGGLAAVRWVRSAAVLLALAAVPTVYTVGRTAGLWSGERLVQVVQPVAPERAQSLGYRLYAEDVLVAHAMKQPVLGWGGWGRNLPVTFDAHAPDVATDGLWVLVLGRTGWFGLAAVLATGLLPAFLLWRRVRGDLWSDPRAAVAVVPFTLLTLFLIDCLMNDMKNPVYLLGAGGLTGALLRAPAPQEAA
jgi:hypothetical protein